jgi:hypothetical protein
MMDLQQCLVLPFVIGTEQRVLSMYRIERVEQQGAEHNPLQVVLATAKLIEMARACSKLVVRCNIISTGCAVLLLALLAAGCCWGPSC